MLCVCVSVCVIAVKIINHTNLLTARPPISLYLRDSHCAIAQRPRAATFSAYNYLTKGAHLIVKYVTYNDSYFNSAFWKIKSLLNNCCELTNSSPFFSKYILSTCRQDNYLSSSGCYSYFYSTITILS